MLAVISEVQGRHILHGAMRKYLKTTETFIIDWHIDISHLIYGTLLMSRELRSAETWVDGKTWYKTVCYWPIVESIDSLANSTKFYIKFSRPLKFQQIWARVSSVVRRG